MKKNKDSKNDSNFYGDDKKQSKKYKKDKKTKGLPKRIKYNSLDKIEEID